MKKIALFVAAIAVSFSVGGKALADTNTVSFADKAGITPDNVLLYPIDKAIDNIRINLTFSADKKAQVLADVAIERLGESEVMADKGKADLSIEAMDDYNDKMAEAQDDIEKAVDNTANSTATSTAANTATNITTNAAVSTTDNTANSTTSSAINSNNLSTVENAIKNDQANSIEVLKSIENKLPANAKQTIAQVIEMQTRKKDAIEAVIKEKQAIVQDVSAVKNAENALEQAQKSGDAQAVQTAENTLKQAQDTLNADTQKLSQAIEAKKEAMKGGVGKLKKEAKQAENNQTDNTVNSSGTTTQTDNSTAPAAASTVPPTSTITPATSSPASTDTTNNTAGTTTNNTAVTNNINTDTTAYKNYGQEMKAQNAKGQKGQEMKTQNANSASHGKGSRD